VGTDRRDIWGDVRWRSIPAGRYEVLYECVESMRKVWEHNRGKAKTRHVKEQPRINGKAMRFDDDDCFHYYKK